MVSLAQLLIPSILIVMCLEYYATFRFVNDHPEMGQYGPYSRTHYRL